MSYAKIAADAAKWALSKIGCKYSQANRTKENIFDCSSLVARAYSAQGKLWKWGGSVPTSTNEVYDDDFELIWPAQYADIGKTMGGSMTIGKAARAGDLQFLCTDKNTSRANKITHVAMVADDKRIVHARGTSYGVRVDDISLYAGKVCALARYNPGCPLRYGMKGYRTQALQKALNANGADLNGDGEFGPKTRAAVMAYQQAKGLAEDGIAGRETLEALGIMIAENAGISEPPVAEAANGYVRVTGGTVNVRKGPGTAYDSVKVAKKGERYAAVDADGWQAVLAHGEVRYISKKYLEKV